MTNCDIYTCAGMFTVFLQRAEITRIVLDEDTLSQITE